MVGLVGVGRLGEFNSPWKEKAINIISDRITKYKELTKHNRILLLTRKLLVRQSPSGLGLYKPLTKNVPLVNTGQIPGKTRAWW